MMRRILLPCVTLGLLTLVVADRIARSVAGAADAQVSQGASPVASIPPTGRSATVPTAPPAAELAPTSTVSTVDRLARLATRQRLSLMGRRTYLDSLIVNTDSVLRRWPDRSGVPLRVAIIPGGAPGYVDRMSGFAHEALDRWEHAALGVTFSTVTDTASADITLRWVDRFAIDRAGQTDLTWDQTGRVRRAAISLALRTNGGLDLPDQALLAVAVHEVGHALGLPHSADSNDVMFPATRTGELSDRDRQTALLLYRLPPGPLRDGATLDP